jgi:hypothetical protein
MPRREQSSERPSPGLRQYNFEDCPDAKLASCCQYEYLASRPWRYLLDPKEAERVVPVYLNPYLPLPQLKKAIAELFQRDYPHLLTKAAKPQWSRAFADLFRRKDPLFKELVESERLSRKRGRGSRIEQYRADLKALSAWRLSRQFGHSAIEAIKLMHAHKLNTYQSERAFYHAVSRAAKKIAALEEQLRQFAENMTA